MKFNLPALPFVSTALAQRGMSQETLELHHDKHHQAYVTELNKLVEKNDALKTKSLEELIKVSKDDESLKPVFNNAGQHWNHSFFWQCLSPTGGTIPAALEKRIIADLGSVAKFKEAFKAAAVGEFGSGWAWLVLAGNGKLVVTKTHDASNPLASGEGKALLTLDVWEHSYYLDFHNLRPNYADNFLDKLANYEFVQRQFAVA